MKPIISKSVYKKLKGLLQRNASPEGKKLITELENAEIVNDSELKKDVVSLNSIVEFVNESLRNPIRLKIVLPEEADLSKKKISILSPISIALIGFKESYVFQWLMPSGYKRLKIVKVENE